MNRREKGVFLRFTYSDIHSEIRDIFQILPSEQFLILKVIRLNVTSTLDNLLPLQDQYYENNKIEANLYILGLIFSAKHKGAFRGLSKYSLVNKSFIYI